MNQPLLPRYSRAVIRRFTPRYISNATRDISPYLLANIHDILMKWGMEFSSELTFEGETVVTACREFIFPEEDRAIQFVLHQSKLPLISVAEFQKEEFRAVEIKCGRPEFVFIWDMELPASEIENAIRKIQSRFQEAGLVCPQTGARIDYESRLDELRELRYDRFAPNISQFTPQVMPKSLDGLTPELIADIYDLVQNFGEEDLEKEVVTYSFYEPEEGLSCHGRCDNITCRDLENGLMTCLNYCKKSNALMVGSSLCESDSLLIFPVQSEKISRIHWDAYIEPSYVQFLIDCCDIDAVMKKRFDFQTGCRKNIATIAQLESIYVDELFTSRQAVYFLDYFGLEDPADALTLIDIPDEVKFIEHDRFGFAMIHRDSKISEQDYVQIILRVLDRHGIISEDDWVEFISDDELRSILQEEILKELLAIHH